MTVAPELLTGLGSALSIFLSSTGAALASAHAGIYAIRGTSAKDFLPIIVAGVLAIYGIIVSVLLVGKLQNPAAEGLTEVDGYRNLSAGLAVGLSCWASGWGLSKFLQQCNDEHVSATTTSGSTLENELHAPLVARSSTTFSRISIVKLCLCLTFLEAIGLYGLIVALFLIG